MIKTNVKYLERAAEDCKFNTDLWIRYLGKFTKEGEIVLTSDEYDLLIGSKYLTKKEKSLLKDFMNPKTELSKYICSINKRNN